MFMIRWGGLLAVTHLTRLCLLLEVMLCVAGLFPCHIHTNYAYVWSGVVSMICEGGLAATSVISYTPIYTRVVVFLV